MVLLDRVRFAGDLVGVVVATSRAAAEDAAAAVVIDASPRDPVLVLDDALDPAIDPIFADLESNLLYDESFVYGDPTLQFSGAPRIVRRSIIQSRQANLPMEGRAVLAAWDGARLVVHASFQNPYALRGAKPEELLRFLAGLDQWLEAREEVLGEGPDIARP